MIKGIDDINMGHYDLDENKVKQVCKEFDRLRFKVRELELFKSNNLFFIRKFSEAVGMIAFAYFLQYHRYYLCSALLMGLAWQQLGWMIHEYCHHQHFKVIHTMKKKKTLWKRGNFFKNFYKNLIS